MLAASSTNKSRLTLRPIQFAGSSTGGTATLTANLGGNILFSGASTGGNAQLVVNALNRRGLPVKGAARANVPGTDQRHNMIFASAIDLDEAYRVGQKAAHLAAAGASGFMATLLREPGPIYNVRYDRVPLEQVANSERSFPATWISGDGTDVTDDYVRYAQPLLGNDWPSIPLIAGRVRLARFKPIFAPPRLPKYVPQTDR